MSVAVALPRQRSGLAPAEVAGLAAIGLIWGCTPLLVKLVVGHVPALWLVTGRIWAGLVVVLLFLRLQHRELPRDARTWIHLTVLGTAGTAVPWIVLAWAQQSMSSSLAAILLAPLPATTLALAVASRLERLSWTRAAGIGLALFGTLAIVGGQLGDGRTRLGAVVAAGLCTVLFAFGSVYAKRHLSGVSGVTVAAGQLLPAAIVVVPVTLLASPAPAWGRMPLAAWVAWLAVGALSTGFAYAVFYGLVDRMGASAAQLSCYLTPPVGALAGFFLLRERLGVSIVVGSLVIVVGLLVAQRGSARVAVPAPEPAHRRPHRSVRRPGRGRGVRRPGRDHGVRPPGRDRGVRRPGPDRTGPLAARLPGAPGGSRPAGSGRPPATAGARRGHAAIHRRRRGRVGASSRH